MSIRRKRLKDKLPIYISSSMTEKIDLTNLSCDVISNISSFILGKPEYMRLKHNKMLKKMQRKFKPHYTKEEREEYEYFEQMSDCREIDMKDVGIKYKLIQGHYRRDLLFCIDKQYEKIKNIIDKEIENQFKQNYDISTINVAIRRKYKDDKEYDVRHLIDNDYFQQWNIKNVQNFDNELKRIINDKQYVEADLNIDYNDDGAVVSSYNISICLRFRML